MPRRPLGMVCCLLCITVFSASRSDAKRVMTLVWKGASSSRLVASHDALLPSRPPHPEASADEDPARFRIEIRNSVRPRSVRMTLVSIDPATGRVRDRLNLRGADLQVANGRVETPWLVLTADEDDRLAPRLAGRNLRAALGDWVEARVRMGGGRAKKWSIRVGRPSFETGPQAIRPVSLSVVVLRTEPDGPPLVGGDGRGVRAVMGHQAAVAREVYAQCGVTFPERDIAVRVADPPGPGLVTVGERFGLPSKGGLIRIVADGKRLGPWKMGSAYTPAQTARLLGHHIAQAGFLVERFENARVPSFAHATADLLVRRPDGTLAHLEPWPGQPVTTDPAQPVDIGRVDLADGVDAYDDLTASTGTLEERTLVRSLSDGNPKTIDVIVVNRFSNPTRQGESFMAGGSVSDGGAVLLDTDALSRARQAYTLSHELGHVLLEDLAHPDDDGASRPFLLMHSRSSSALQGPKRLTSAQCKKIRRTIEGRYFDYRSAQPQGDPSTPSP